MSRQESDCLRALVGYEDGSVPAHIGVESLRTGGEMIWRIEDGEHSGKAWDPPVEDDTNAHAVALIAKHLTPDAYNPAIEEWRLKERRVPVWAITGGLTQTRDNADEVAATYRVSREAVDAARLLYIRHRAAIDARLAAHQER